VAGPADSAGGRWTTLDRIVSIGDGEATAVRNVPNTLAIFDSHFPRFHVLPGVLILGSMGTLCSQLLEQETGERWRLTGADRVGFRHFVQPGDELELSVKLRDRSEDEAVLSGEASVEGKLVTRARKLRASRLT
jgi:3-hydroxyacyl-[acyl-carrier-protein] dehydratase